MPFDRLADKYLQIKENTLKDATYGWHGVNPKFYVLGWQLPSGVILYSEAYVEQQLSEYWKCGIYGSSQWSLHVCREDAMAAAKEHLGVNLP